MHQTYVPRGELQSNLRTLILYKGKSILSTPLILRLFGIKINLQKPPLKLDNVITYAYNKLVLFNWGVRSGVGGVPCIKNNDSKICLYMTLTNWNLKTIKL